jgi:hypothetical protein
LGPCCFPYADKIFYRDAIGFRLDWWQSSTHADEHALGQLLLWGVLFTDGTVANLAQAFAASGYLEASETRELYDHLIVEEVA